MSEPQYIVPRPPRSQILRKSSQVVMAREHGDLTLLDRKLFNFLLHRASHNLAENRLHAIPVEDALTFIRKRSTTSLHESLARLGRVNIEIDYMDEAGVAHSARMHFLSYDLSHTSNGMLHYAFDQMLLQFIKDPRVFSAINMQIMKSFRSTYAVKLYEIMAMHEKRLHPVWTTTIENFRSMFGIESNAYRRTDNLRKRIIDKAVSEVNEIAEFDVRVEYIRGGRGGKVTGLRFETVPKDYSLPVPVSTRVAAPSGRDANTVDMMDGLTDAERGDTLVISREARADAIELIADRGDVDHYEDLWRETMRGRRVRDASASFLSWLKLRLEREEEDSLVADIDEDAFAALLSRAESLRSQ